MNQLTPSTPAERAGEPRGPVITIAGFLILLTLCAACFAIGMAAPGLGVVLAIVVLPAALRFLLATGRRRMRGAPLPLGGMASLFVVSLMLVLVIEGATIIAFVSVCVPAGLVGMSVTYAPGGMMIAVLSLSALVSLGFSGWLLVQLWDMPDRAFDDRYPQIPFDAEIMPESRDP